MVRKLKDLSPILPEFTCLSRLKSKWSYMNSTFGSNTLTILFLVYWSQGFKSLSNVAITLYYKDNFGLDPSVTQYIRTLIMVAWLITV